MPAVESSFWNGLPLNAGVRVAKNDANGLAALDKPAGVMSHPNSANDRGRALVTAPYDAENECYLLPGGEAGESPRRLWLLNRLDSATSGAILVAADPEVAAAVKGRFQQRQVAKTYLALVFGHFRPAREIWRDRMAVTRSGPRVRASDDGGLGAETHVRRIRLIPGPPALTLLELEPKTGRTHQLRHQCARRHLPIVGDQNYGDFRLNREFARRVGTKRLFLHSHTIALDYELAGRRFTFKAEAPLPAEFRL